MPPTLDFFLLHFCSLCFLFHFALFYNSVWCFRHSTRSTEQNEKKRIRGDRPRWMSETHFIYEYMCMYIYKQTLKLDERIHIRNYLGRPVYLVASEPRGAWNDPVPRHRRPATPRRPAISLLPSAQVPALRWHVPSRNPLTKRSLKFFQRSLLPPPALLAYILSFLSCWLRYFHILSLGLSSTTLTGTLCTVLPLPLASPRPNLSSTRQREG